MYKGLLPIIVESDLAMGSTRGDVDDAFAVACILGIAPQQVACIASTYGNTSEGLANRNLHALCRLYAKAPIVVSGAVGPKQDAPLVRDAIRKTGDVRFLALGPLTSLSSCVHSGEMSYVKEAIIVGTRPFSWGRWPPLLPHEFNLTQDRMASANVFNSQLPLTIVPLSVAAKIRFHPRVLGYLSPSREEFFQRGIKRWVRRSILVRGSIRFPVWDLAACAYALHPELCRVEEWRVIYNARGFLSRARIGRSVRVVVDIDEELVWNMFKRSQIVEGTAAPELA